MSSFHIGASSILKCTADQRDRPHSLAVRATARVARGWGSILDRLTPKMYKMEGLCFSAWHSALKGLRQLAGQLGVSIMAWVGTSLHTCGV